MCWNGSIKILILIVICHHVSSVAIKGKFHSFGKKFLCGGRDKDKDEDKSKTNNAAVDPNEKLQIQTFGYTSNSTGLRHQPQKPITGLNHKPVTGLNHQQGNRNSLSVPNDSATAAATALSGSNTQIQPASKHQTGQRKLSQGSSNSKQAIELQKINNSRPSSPSSPGTNHNIKSENHSNVVSTQNVAHKIDPLKRSDTVISQTAELLSDSPVDIKGKQPVYVNKPIPTNSQNAASTIQTNKSEPSSPVQNNKASGTNQRPNTATAKKQIPGHYPDSPTPSEAGKSSKPASVASSSKSETKHVPGAFPDEPIASNEQNNQQPNNSSQANNPGILSSITSGLWSYNPFASTPTTTTTATTTSDNNKPKTSK